MRHRLSCHGLRSVGCGVSQCFALHLTHRHIRRHVPAHPLQKITGLHLVGFHHDKYRCSAALEAHPAPEGRVKQHPVAVEAMGIADRKILGGGAEAEANGEGHAHGEGAHQKEK